MTRWKREYREWAKRSGFVAYVTPKEISHESWAMAKVMSALVDQQACDPAFQKIMDEEFMNLLMYGTTHPHMTA